MRHLNKKTFTRPRNDVFEPSDTALCLGAIHNMSPLNNRCVVITCFSNPQDHSVTRGGKDNSCPTLVAPTKSSDSHGTPHGVAIINQSINHSINQSINQSRKKERK